MSYFLDDDASQIRDLKDKLEKLQSDFLSTQFSPTLENIDSGQNIIPGANPSARGGQEWWVEELRQLILSYTQ